MIDLIAPIRALTKGWDSYDGDPPRAEDVYMAERIAGAATPSQVSPVAGGDGVAIFYPHGYVYVADDQYATIRYNADGTRSYDDVSEEQAVTFAKESPC